MRSGNRQIMDLPMVSIITWDASFREAYHAVDFMSRINYPRDKFDVTWVEYYGPARDALEQKSTTVSNLKLICLNASEQWHAGRCLNAGIRSTSGDLLVLIDGDVVLEETFLRQAADVHASHSLAAVYARRWDEPGEAASSNSLNIDHLKAVCRPDVNPNFGGCLIISRKTLERVGGYEEHPVFGGPGVVSGELAVRIRNAGIPVLWPPTLRVFHPWHSGTLPDTDTAQQRRQAWVLQNRSRHMDCQADAAQVDQYLRSFPAQTPSSALRQARERVSRFVRRVQQRARAR